MSGAPADPSASSIRLLQLTAFVSTLDRFAMPPMIVAIAVDLGAPLSQVVQAAGAYYLAYGLMQPAWGIVSHRLGLVRTLRTALVLSAAGSAASALAGSALALGILRGLTGGFFAAAIPSALVYVGETVTAARRQRQITRLMEGVAIGTALSSAFAGALAQVLSWRVAFLVTGGAALVLAVALRRLAEPPPGNDGRLLAAVGRAVRSRTALLVLLLAFTEGAVLLGALTLLPPAVQATGASSAVAGAVTAAHGVAVYGSARLVGLLSRGHHPALLIGAGGAAALAACGLMAASQQPPAAAGAAILLGLAWAGMHSSLQTWATEVLPSARAAVVSMFAGSLFAGSAVGAQAFAGLAGAGRYDDIFLIAAVVVVPLSVVATWGRAVWRGPEEELR
jgi:predicted MFS family arabinose efflux permease